MDEDSESGALSSRLVEGWSSWAVSWQQQRSIHHLFQCWDVPSEEVRHGVDLLTIEAKNRQWPLLILSSEAYQPRLGSFNCVRQALEYLLPIVVSERVDIPLAYRHILYSLMHDWWMQVYGVIPDAQEPDWLVPRTPSLLDFRIISSRETCTRLANGTALFWQEISQNVRSLQTPWTIVLEYANLCDRWSLATIKRFISLASSHPLCLIMITSQYSSHENGLEWTNGEALQADIWKRFLQTLPIQVVSAGVHISSLSSPDKSVFQEVDVPLHGNALDEDLPTLMDWCDSVGLLRLATRQAQHGQSLETRAQARFTAARGWILEQHHTSALECLVAAFEESVNPVFRAECAIYAGVLSANIVKDPPVAHDWVNKGLLVLGDMQDVASTRARGWLHNVAALAFYREKDYSQSEKEIESALEIAHNLERESGVVLEAALVENLSLLYEAMGFMDRALTVLQGFSHLYRQGCLLWKSGRREEAEEAWENASIMANRYRDDYILDWIARAAACAWSEANVWGRALYWAQRSLVHARAVGNYDGEVRSLLALALLHQLNGNSEYAQYYCNCAIYQRTCHLKEFSLDNPLLTHVCTTWLHHPPSGDASLLLQLFPRPATRLAYPFRVFDL